MLARSLAFASIAIVAVGCTKTRTGDASFDGGGDGSDGAVKAAPVAPDASTDDDDVKSVYPIDGVAANPLATRLCTALHDLPEKRRSQCCSDNAGVVATSECVRMLSAALQGNAVSLEVAAVDTCASAMDRAHAGCDWVGPFPPQVPAACLGIIKGKLAARSRCRSSLECAGDLRCHGVGPTTVGRCGPARDEGGACAGSSDALATFARQNDVDRAHPECRGYCSRFKCAPLVTEGGACAQSRECGAGLECVGASTKTKTGKCVARAPAKAGEACPGEVCEGDLQCVGGRCAARKPAGATCTTDFECLGGCLKPDAGVGVAAGNRGVCGRKCGVR